MLTTTHFADAVGRKQIGDAVGVQMTAVSNAVVRGRFPASWFNTCSILAAEAGVECPPALFGQKSTNPQPVNARQKVQCPKRSTVGDMTQ